MAGNTVDWGSTSDALSALLGFDETEDWDDEEENYLIGSSPHTHGWYPGTISYGLDCGAGDIHGGDWLRDWPEVSSVSGSRRFRRVGPDQPNYHRTAEWDCLHKSEVLHPARGVDALERAFCQPVRYYPDRSLGTVADPGDQGDPEVDPRDESCDFWLCYLRELPGRDHHSQSATFRVVTLVFHSEPAD